MLGADASAQAAEFNVERTKSVLADAQRNLKLNQEMADAGVIARRDLDTAKAAVAQAAAQMFPCDACAMVRGGAGAVSRINCERDLEQRPQSRVRAGSNGRRASLKRLLYGCYVVWQQGSRDSSMGRDMKH